MILSCQVIKVGQMHKDYDVCVAIKACLLDHFIKLQMRSLLFISSCYAKYEDVTLIITIFKSENNTRSNIRCLIHYIYPLCKGLLWWFSSMCISE